jgi:hypothetical protein
MLTNYIPDENKFKLAGPPKWWLEKLRDFDESLVVIPSRQGFFYRLAQRRKLQIPEHIVNESLWQFSDTQMMARYGLVPVTTIIATCTWSDWMFHELEQRAPHRLGGAQKVIKHLEEREDAEGIKRRKETDHYLTDISKDGWKLYQAKTGQRTFVDSTKRDSRVSARTGGPRSSSTPTPRASVRSNPSGNPQSGILIVG